MEDKVIIAVITAAAVVIGGLVTVIIGPLVAHKLRHAEASKDQKRLLIQKWREMVNDIHNRSQGDVNVKPEILAHPDFPALEPHLSKEVLAEIRSKSITIILGNVGLARPLRALSDEISRIERDWKLL